MNSFFLTSLGDTMMKQFAPLQTTKPSLKAVIKLPGDPSVMWSFLKRHPHGHLKSKSSSSPVIERSFKSTEDITLLFPSMIFHCFHSNALDSHCKTFKDGYKASLDEVTLTFSRNTRRLQAKFMYTAKDERGNLVII
jgi:hypothetical protein